MSKVRTRFAPSPTGRMHVGNLRTALYAYLIARHAGGDFILRIEDTDQERQVEGAEEIIYNTLKKAGMNHDEGPDIDGGVGPYVQSERQAQGLYLKYAKELIDKGEAYYCFCDQERLDTLKVKSGDVVISHYDKHCLNLSKEEVQAKLDAGVPYVIRQNNPTEGTTSFVDEIYGEITVDNIELDDMILIKSDGYPTYNFANVVDDHLMGITHVVRGNEYLSSTPKYNRLYDAFGWEKPVYIHCPLITDEEHHKLSKRKGHSSFEDLIEQGFLPETIVNFVALLGWSPETNQEVFTMDELIANFNENRISKSSSQYDVKKLKWFNHHYINNLSDEEYLTWIKKYFTNNTEGKTEDWINKLLLVYKNHIDYGAEINEVTASFFDSNFEINEDAAEFMKSDEVIPHVVEVFKEEIENTTDWTVETLSNVINNVKEKAGVKGKMLYMPIRIAASGIMHGPELADTLYLIGKEEILNRLTK